MDTKYGFDDNDVISTVFGEDEVKTPSTKPEEKKLVEKKEVINEMAVKESERSWEEPIEDVAKALVAEINKTINVKGKTLAKVEQRRDTSTGELSGHDITADQKIIISRLIKMFDAKKKTIDIDLQWHQNDKDGPWGYRAFIKAKKAKGK